jgi:hypothetical protein
MRQQNDFKSVQITEFNHSNKNRYTSLSPSQNKEGLNEQQQKKTD